MLLRSAFYNMFSALSSFLFNIKKMNTVNTNQNFNKVSKADLSLEESSTKDKSAELTSKLNQLQYKVSTAYNKDSNTTKDKPAKLTSRPLKWSVTKVIKDKPAKLTSLANAKLSSSHSFKFLNQCFDKGRIKNFVLWFLINYGEDKTVKLLDELKKVGFEVATKAGISLGIDDLRIPPKKSMLLLEAEKNIQTTVQSRGDITGVERFQRLIDTWHRTSEQLKQEVINHFEATDSLNPVYMMAFSGARGNISQVRQLVGMRGLMADPQGQILDFPIRSNFREGLTLTEYVISCYGARKGIVDTALRTATAGYLTRRLVDVAQHVIISHYDCGTHNGILLTEVKEGKKTLVSLQNRLVGRVLARNVVSTNTSSSKAKDTPKDKSAKLTSSIIAYRNQEIYSDLAFKIAQATKKVFVRSPLTCETKKTICQLCYGWSLAQGNLVSIGEAVGIVAGQSIGEPGTQLTMRTFHTGGVFSGDVNEQIKAPFSGSLYYNHAIPGNLVRTFEGKIAFLTKAEGKFSIYKKNPSFKDIATKDKPAILTSRPQKWSVITSKDKPAELTSRPQKWSVITSKDKPAELTSRPQKWSVITSRPQKWSVITSKDKPAELTSRPQKWSVITSKDKPAELTSRPQKWSVITSRPQKWSVITSRPQKWSVITSKDKPAELTSRPLKWSVTKVIKDKPAKLTSQFCYATPALKESIQKQSPMQLSQVKTYKIPPFTLLFVRNGDQVIEKEVVAQISAISKGSNITDEAEFTLKSELEGEFITENSIVKYYNPLPTKDKQQSKKTTIDKSAELTFSPQGVNQCFNTFDFVQKAWGWGYAWILSGKIYQLFLPSHFLPQSGDFIHKGTLMNQTLLLCQCHNATLGFSNITKDKPAELTSTSLLSSHFIKTSNITNPFLSEVRQCSALELKTPILSLKASQISFKNIGYVIKPFSCFATKDKPAKLTSIDLGSLLLKAQTLSEKDFILSLHNIGTEHSTAISREHLAKRVIQKPIQKKVSFAGLSFEANQLSYNRTAYSVSQQVSTRWSPLLKSFLYWVPLKTQTTTGGIVSLQSLACFPYIYSTKEKPAKLTPRLLKWSVTKVIKDKSAQLTSKDKPAELTSRPLKWSVITSKDKPAELTSRPQKWSVITSKDKPAELTSRPLKWSVTKVIKDKPAELTSSRLLLKGQSKALLDHKLITPKDKSAELTSYLTLQTFKRLAKEQHKQNKAKLQSNKHISHRFKCAALTNLLEVWRESNQSIQYLFTNKKAYNFFSNKTLFNYLRKSTITCIANPTKDKSAKLTSQTNGTNNNLKHKAKVPNTTKCDKATLARHFVAKRLPTLEKKGSSNTETAKRQSNSVTRFTRLSSTAVISQGLHSRLLFLPRLYLKGLFYKTLQNYKFPAIQATSKDKSAELTSPQRKGVNKCFSTYGKNSYTIKTSKDKSAELTSKQIGYPITPAKIKEVSSLEALKAEKAFYLVNRQGLKKEVSLTILNQVIGRASSFCLNEKAKNLPFIGFLTRKETVPTFYYTIKDLTGSIANINNPLVNPDQILFIKGSASVPQPNMANSIKTLNNFIALKHLTFASAHHPVSVLTSKQIKVKNSLGLSQTFTKTFLYKNVSNSQVKQNKTSRKPFFICCSSNALKRLFTINSKDKSAELTSLALLYIAAQRLACTSVKAKQQYKSLIKELDCLYAKDRKAREKIVKKGWVFCPFFTHSKSSKPFTNTLSISLTPGKYSQVLLPNFISKVRYSQNKTSKGKDIIFDNHKVFADLYYDFYNTYNQTNSINPFLSELVISNQITAQTTAIEEVSSADLSLKVSSADLSLRTLVTYNSFSYYMDVNQNSTLLHSTKPLTSEGLASATFRAWQKVSNPNSRFMPSFYINNINDVSSADLSLEINQTLQSKVSNRDLSRLRVARHEVARLQSNTGIYQNKPKKAYIIFQKVNNFVIPEKKTVKKELLTMLRQSNTHFIIPNNTKQDSSHPVKLYPAYKSYSLLLAIRNRTKQQTTKDKSAELTSRPQKWSVITSKDKPAELTSRPQKWSVITSKDKPAELTSRPLKWSVTKVIKDKSAELTFSPQRKGVNKCFSTYEVSFDGLSLVEQKTRQLYSSFYKKRLDFNLIQNTPILKAVNKQAKLQSKNLTTLFSAKAKPFLLSKQAFNYSSFLISIASKDKSAALTSILSLNKGFPCSKITAPKVPSITTIPQIPSTYIANSSSINHATAPIIQDRFSKAKANNILFVNTLIEQPSLDVSIVQELNLFGDQNNNNLLVTPKDKSAELTSRPLKWSVTKVIKDKSAELTSRPLKWSVTKSYKDKSAELTSRPLKWSVTKSYKDKSAELTSRPLKWSVTKVIKDKSAELTSKDKSAELTSRPLKWSVTKVIKEKSAELTSNNQTLVQTKVSQSQTITSNKGVSVSSAVIPAKAILGSQLCSLIFSSNSITSGVRIAQKSTLDGEFLTKRPYNWNVSNLLSTYINTGFNKQSLFLKHKHTKGKVSLKKAKQQLILTNSTNKTSQYKRSQIATKDKKLTSLQSYLYSIVPIKGLVLTKNDQVSYYLPKNSYKQVCLDLVNLTKYYAIKPTKATYPSINMDSVSIKGGSPAQLNRLQLGEFLVYGDLLGIKEVSSADLSLVAVKTAGQIIHISNNKVTLRKGQPILISPKSILHSTHGDFVVANKPVITLSYQKLKTGDIVQGIPKVEQFFEARTTKRGRLFLQSVPNLLNAIFKRYCKKYPLHFAVKQSFYKIQQVLVDGVMRVYRTQGVSISEKHLEVIVKQMTTKVRIVDGSNTGFFPGEIVDLDFITAYLLQKAQSTKDKSAELTSYKKGTKVVDVSSAYFSLEDELLNRSVESLGLVYEPIVLGITKASLGVDSFLSAASFQQTTKVLSKAAISKKKDFLKGLKENVLIGNLIPAGTGYLVYLNKRSKLSKDKSAELTS
uniref:RNA polymerase b''-subunit n=1 Tax=Leontynka pallida TaxID=2912034 RepID=UPI0020283F5C|nr:RNA polymerase b''-subunit [Leontynka pallida]UPQ43856.1 RNA polymerase b''-subunit [Leontynka pallida]